MLPNGEDAGPEAGAPKEAAVEIGCSRAFGGRLEAGFGEKWLCSITRIYTQLHAFTQSSWALTLRTQTKRKSPQKGNGDWPQKNAENAKRVGNGVLGCWRDGRMRAKAVESGLEVGKGGL